MNLCDWCNKPNLEVHYRKGPYFESLCPSHHTRRKGGWPNWLMGIPLILEKVNYDNDILIKLACYGVPKTEIVNLLQSEFVIEPNFNSLLVGREPIFKKLREKGVTI